MIGYEIIFSTGIIVSFILGWTERIYVKPLINEYEEIIKKLDQHHDSIRRKVSESEADKTKFIDELINLWDFRNIRSKFESEIIEVKSSLQKKMLPEGIAAIFISIIYVGVINNIIIISFNILDVLVLIDGFILLALIAQAYSCRDVIIKISKLNEGSEITEIYSIGDVFT